MTMKGNNAKTEDEQIRPKTVSQDKKRKVCENARRQAPFVAIQILQTQAPLERERPRERFDGETIEEVVALCLEPKQCPPGEDAGGNS